MDATDPAGGPGLRHAWPRDRLRVDARRSSRALPTADIEGDAILARLKRLLRPLRPVLLPVWRRVRPLVEFGGRERLRMRLARARDEELARVDRLRGRPPAPIRPLRRYEILALAERVKYYKARTGYMTVAAGIAGDLIDRHRLTSALELGPHIRPLIVGADVMDITSPADLESEGRVILHDATRSPWPVDDRQYDLFVGLQVFEHLGKRQDVAFREVCRVARHAVISLPIDWDMADPKDCHHRLSSEKVLSWFLPVVPTRVVLGNGGSKKRFIYVFEDLPAPSAPSAPLAAPAVAPAS